MGGRCSCRSKTCEDVIIDMDNPNQCMCWDTYAKDDEYIQANDYKSDDNNDSFNTGLSRLLLLINGYIHQQCECKFFESDIIQICTLYCIKYNSLLRTLDDFFKENNDRIRG